MLKLRYNNIMKHKIQHWEQIPLGRKVLIEKTSTGELISAKFIKVHNNDSGTAIINNQEVEIRKYNYNVFVYPLHPLPEVLGSVIRIFIEPSEGHSEIKNLDITLTSFNNNLIWVSIDSLTTLTVWDDSSLAHINNWEWIVKPVSREYIDYLEDTIEEDTDLLLHVIAQRSELKTIIETVLDREKLPDESIRELRESLGLLNYSSTALLEKEYISNYAVEHQWRVGHELGDDAMPPLANMNGVNRYFSSYEEAKHRLNNQQKALISGNVPLHSYLWNYRIEHRINSVTQWKMVTK
jgi:hypothetical protein